MKNMKNKTGERRPCCKRCFHPGFKQSVNDGPDRRPRFTCDKCGDSWTYGKDGGPYIGHAINWSKKLGRAICFHPHSIAGESYVCIEDPGHASGFHSCVPRKSV